MARIRFRSSSGRRTSPVARLAIASVIVVIAGISYCMKRSHNDVTGETQYVALTVQQEVSLGLAAAPGVAKKFGGELSSPSIERYVEKVGQRMAGVTGSKTDAYRYDFHVLADPKTVNAFALPGGQIFITVGLLKLLHSEAELGAVLGHEVGHVVARHGAEHMAQAQFGQAIAGAAGIAVSDDRRTQQQAAALASAVTALVKLEYSREDEMESDELGVRFLKAAGYDARAMIDLMKVLEQASAGRSRPEFFSSHPNPGNRIENIEGYLEKDGGKTGGDRGEEEFAKNVLAELR